MRNALSVDTSSKDILVRNLIIPPTPCSCPIFTLDESSLCNAFLLLPQLHERLDDCDGRFRTAVLLLVVLLIQTDTQRSNQR